MCEDADSRGLFNVNDNGYKQFIQNIRSSTDDFLISPTRAVAGGTAVNLSSSHYTTIVK